MVNEKEIGCCYDSIAVCSASKADALNLIRAMSRANATTIGEVMANGRR